MSDHLLFLLLIMVIRDLKVKITIENVSPH